MSANDERRTEITRLVTDIEYLQGAAGIPADPGDHEAWEILDRIERRLRSIDLYREPPAPKPGAAV